MREIKLYTQNTKELRQRLHDAGVNGFPRSRKELTDNSWWDLKYLYADCIDDSITQSSTPGLENCKHTTADEFFDSVLEWYGIENPNELKPGTMGFVDDYSEEDAKKDNEHCELRAIVDGKYVCRNREGSYAVWSYFVAIEQPKEIELTIEQIAEKFGMDASKIRIKK